MKKIALLLAIMTIGCMYALAQNKGIILKGSLSVGKQENSGFDTTAYADTTTWIEVGKDTTNKGMILPRVDINSYSTGKKGVFVYDVNDSVLYHLDGTDKIRYLRQKDMANILGQYFKQGGDSLGATGVLGTNDVQAFIIETNDSARARVDSFGKWKFGDVDTFRTIIDPVNNRYDTTDNGNIYSYEFLKA